MITNGLISCTPLQLDGQVKELFPIGQSRTEPEMLPLMDDKILVLKDEVQVGHYYSLI